MKDVSKDVHCTLYVDDFTIFVQYIMQGVSLRKPKYNN